MGKQKLITGTIILTLASLITRVLGFIFRVYMSNLMGAEGIGLYQLIFPIYMLIWAASSAGISLAVSKKVAEFSAKGLHHDGIKTLRVALFLSLSISCFLSLIVFLFAPFVATNIIHEPRTGIALRYLCLCIPFMAASCCIKGYFQGKQQMSVPAICQIGEQVARMVAIYFLAAFFVPKGIEYACALGAIGLCFGEVMSFLLGYFFYLQKKKKLPKKSANFTYRSLFSTLLGISIPLTANRFLTSSLASIENILIPLQLQKFGFSPSHALSTYGMISGMAVPLLFFPAMVTMSISMVLVPAISEAVATHNKRSLTKTISKSIQLATFIGIGASSLFLMLGNEIALACYGIEEVGYLLRLLAIICPFIYLQNIFTGMLNGLGLQRLTFKGNVLASSLCIVLLLVLVPRLGVVGYMLAILSQSVFATLFDLLQVLRNTYILVDLRNWIIKPLIAAGIGCVFMHFFHQTYLVPAFSLRISTLLACALLAGFYGLFLILLGAVSKEDLEMILR